MDRAELNSFHKPYKTDIYFCSFLFILLLVLYMPILPDMYHELFRYNNNSHGILVPFIFLYFIWKLRKTIQWSDIRPSYFGGAVLIGSLLLYVVGLIGGIKVISRLCFVSTLIGLIWFNFGSQFFRKIAFPLCFLFFMVPIPVAIIGLISFPLQLNVTNISYTIISSLGIAVLQEGNILHFVNTSLEVAEACSGIRSLVAYIMLGYLFAYLSSLSYTCKMLLFLIAIPLSIIVNVVRVTVTGLMAHFFGGHIARGFLHEFSGLLVFALGFIIYGVVFLLLEKRADSKNIVLTLLV